MCTEKYVKGTKVMLTVKILGIEVLCPSEDLELLIVFTKLCCLRGREAELVDPLLEKLILGGEERVSFISVSSISCSIVCLWWALTGGWDWMSPISRLTSSGFWWSTNTKEHCTKKQDQWVCMMYYMHVLPSLQHSEDAHWGVALILSYIYLPHSSMRLVQ